MPDTAVDVLAEKKALHRRRAYEAPLETLNPAWASAFRDDGHWAYFERLRAEDPVHYTPDSNYGAFWSVTKYNDIMAIDTNHQVFSSAKGIGLSPKPSVLPADAFIRRETSQDASDDANSFINMDPPGHDIQRKTVSPAVAPTRLHEMAPVIRERAGLILDSLPIGEPFDWVDLVSKELTAMTLATLFDFPFEERRRLTHWSDMMTNAPGFGPVKSWDHKREELDECFGVFRELWNERVNAPPKFDLISMLAHGEATRNMDVHEYNGNLGLLIIGGNDTTRNTPKHSSSSSRLWSQLFTGPWPGGLVIMSDQWVSRRRSSNGKSKSVASVIAVSSLETRSTQSNSSPIGSPSRMIPARSRITGAIRSRLAGATTGLTVLRCTSCLGGSIEMKLWRCGRLAISAFASRLCSVMPSSDENTWWLVSTAMMSL